MGRRRKAREVALQLLYQLDVQGEGNPEPHLGEFWSRHPVDPDAREFAEALVRGTKLHEAKIDELISQYAENWELDRMAVVDRNVLRQGIFELLWMGEAPAKVVINEAHRGRQEVQHAGVEPLHQRHPRPRPQRASAAQLVPVPIQGPPSATPSCPTSTAISKR